MNALQFQKKLIEHARNMMKFCINAHRKSG